MIVKFRVLRKDTKAPIQGAKIVLEHGETDGITNPAGEAEIVIFWSGNMMYSVDAAGYTKISGTVQVPTAGSITLVVDMGVFVESPQPPKPGEWIEGTVGSSCDLIAKEMLGGNFHSYRNRYSASSGSWYGSAYDARYFAEKDSRCFQQSPPAPKTVDDVQKDVDILRSTLQGISSQIQAFSSTLSSIGTALVDLEARIKAWIEEQILDLLWKAMQRDEKVK